MYSNGLIGDATKNIPDFDVIIKEFQAGMSWFTSMDKLKDHVRLLLKSFNSQGGSLSIAVTVLQTELSKRGIKVNIEQTTIASND